MNVQFHNHISILPREDVDSISGIEIIPKEGRSLDNILAENDILPTDQPEEKSGNVFYRQRLNVVADKLDAQLAEKYSRSRPVLVKLYRSDGEVVIWGTPESPVRVAMVPYPGHTTLELTRNGPDPML